MSNQKETFSKGRALKPIFSSYCSTAQDRTLSLAARGLLFYYLSFPEGWKFHPKKVQDDNEVGEDRFLSLNKELIEAGYLIRWQEKGTKGRWGDTHYEAFYDKDSAQARSAEVEKLNNRIVHNQAKPRKSYEQKTESKLPEEKQEKASTGGFEPHREKPEPGKTRCIEKSTKVDFKQDKKNSYSKSSKQENSPRSQVDNSKSSYQHAKRDQHSIIKEEAKRAMKALDGSVLVGASKNAKDLITALGNKEHRAIEELQEEFPCYWDEIDLLSQSISWMQLYVTFHDCKRYWELKERSNNPVKNKFEYYIMSLYNYVKNLKDSSLNEILFALKFMSKK